MGPFKVVFWLIFGLAALTAIGTLIAQVWGAAFVLQNPDKVGDFIRDVAAPVIQEIKK